MRISGQGLNKKEERQPIAYKTGSRSKLFIAAVSAALVLLVVAAFSIRNLSGRFFPNLLAPHDAAIEARVISSLKTYHTAEVTYFSTSDDAAYGTFDDLIGARLIQEKQSQRPEQTYNFYLTRSAARDRYCIVAVSEKATASFAVSDGGVIYVSDAERITCENGVLGGKMKPLQ